MQNNPDERPLAFERAELARRLTLVKKAMSGRHIDALLVIEEANIAWLTGYEGYSAYVPQMMLVTLAASRPMLVLREMDLPCARASTCLEEADLLCYEEALLGLSCVPVWSCIGQIVGDRTYGANIALERSASGLTYDAYNALLAALGREPVDASGWLNEARAVKSEAELRYMREAAAIADRALSAGISEIEVGARECDVGATILQQLSAGTPQAPGGWPIAGVNMPVGRIANAPHLKWSDGRYMAGAQTNFELGAYRHRYCSAVSRTAYLGRPPSELLRLDGVVRSAFESTLPALRSGARCSDAYAAFQRAFAPHGVRKESRIGYGIGLDWAEGSYSLQRDDERVLLENSTVHLIIGIWEREYGYVFSETLLIGKDGAVSFSRLPRQLFIKD